jgi:hypothetical protein
VPAGAIKGEHFAAMSADKSPGSVSNRAFFVRLAAGGIVDPRASADSIVNDDIGTANWCEPPIGHVGRIVARYST